MSIHDTVTTEMRNQGLHGYTEQARPVITKLVEREQKIADAIVSVATDNGLNAAEVRTALADAGMHVEAPAAAGGDLENRVSVLERALAEAKRRFGF